MADKRIEASEMINSHEKFRITYKVLKS